MGVGWGWGGGGEGAEVSYIILVVYLYIIDGAISIQHALFISVSVSLAFY